MNFLVPGRGVDVLPLDDQRVVEQLPEVLVVRHNDHAPTFGCSLASERANDVVSFNARFVDNLDSHGAQQVIQRLALRNEARLFLRVFDAIALVLGVDLVPMCRVLSVHCQGNVRRVSVANHRANNVDRTLDGIRVKAFAGGHLRHGEECPCHRVAAVKDQQQLLFLTLLGLHSLTYTCGM
ncbi:hypothetical protein D3C71_1180430 [compost metagenome]